MTRTQTATLDKLIEVLQALPSSDGLMNPYGSANGPAPASAGDEIGEVADTIRTHNFRSIVSTLVDAGSKILLCGEAPSHMGARFTGYAFTSERETQSAGFPFSECALLPAAESGARKLKAEASALFVWRAMERAPIPAVFHNALPLHPHPEGNPTKNRTPSAEEWLLGQESLALMVELIAPRLVVAVGKTAERALQVLGLPAVTVRHPSHGGAPLMTKQLEELGVIGPPPTDPQQSLL